jgi:hypothetical protein
MKRTLVMPVQVRAWQTRLRPWARTAGLGWHRHLGVPAMAGAVLLVAVALVQWQVRPAQQREQSKLQTRQQLLATLPRAERASDPAAARAPLQTSELPSTAQRGRDVEWIVTAAERHALTLDRADYTLGTSTGNAVARVEATLPLTGTYPALREFVGAVLNELPHASLESLQIERPNTQSPQLQATARIVLFYKPGNP